VLCSTEMMPGAVWKNSRLKGRIPELDGVRGLAILLVLVWHYIVATVSVSIRTWQAYALVPFRLTWSGVDLFFVLSGFLIGGILYDAKESNNYFKTFYCRRIFRIFPIYFIWVVLFLFGLYAVGNHSSAPLRALFNWDIPVWSYLVFTQNVFMSAHRNWGPRWMAITWSLAVEEQFYLLLPFLVWRLSYRGITKLAVLSIVLAPIARGILLWSGNDYFGPYTLLPCRADALGFGVLIAMACRNETAWAWFESHRPHLCAAFLALGCGVVFLTLRQRYLYGIGLTWIAAFYSSMLLITVVNPREIGVFIFRSQLLRKLGTVAFAVYLFHQGINSLFHMAIFGAEPKIVGLPTLGVTILSLATVLLLSAMSWNLLEKPLIRHAHSRYQYTMATESITTTYPTAL
jgi:peptidoglycan/LPS O-acetylase OafA/YrhL